MKYYIAADGGGTKILSVLYDEELNIIKIVRQRGSSIMGKSDDVTRSEIEKALDELIPPYVTEIEALDVSIVMGRQLYLDLLKERVSVREVNELKEYTTALASTGASYGIVAQAGTGSDAFAYQKDENFAIGGWGATLGDEGSGYDMGLKAIKAAIYHSDGRGEATVLTEMIRNEWGIGEDFYDLVFKVAKSTDYRNLIASATKFLSKAAALGDKIAISIIENAGRDLALQVIAAIKRLGGEWQGPIVTSGGAWRTSAIMRKAFDETLLTVYPNADIRWPYFEPVAGCALLRRYKMGESFEAVRDKFEKSFAIFKYETP